MVTAGAWDISPAWTAQLRQGGRLVVPLRMRGLTRSVAFTQVAGEHGMYLESESARICGFVPMQGSTAHREELLLVKAPRRSDSSSMTACRPTRTGWTTPSRHRATNCGPASRFVSRNSSTPSRWRWRSACRASARWPSTKTWTRGWSPP
ncbi:hypothetical protein [Streptomyces sp. NPDC057428]|uniref:hypothetical protein n=1 Tax=Streptomyces sp. NPDC057428 TaxID=3346129 RepID=UPI00368BB236